MIKFYFYDEQLRKYLLQFCNIFAGLSVQTGKGECEVPEFMSVPIRIGSKDRVVAAIEAGNTQGRPFSLPMMAAQMTGLSLAPQMRKGVGTVDRRAYLPDGGVWPNDIKTITRVMPVPYMMSLELALYASNTQQLHQILEQILVLFDPTIQLQKTDAAFDWTKITTVELTALNNEENYAPGGDRRTIVWTLNFDMPIYLSMPLDVRNELVRTILIRLSDMSSFSVQEFDSEGNLSAFEPYDFMSARTISVPVFTGMGNGTISVSVKPNTNLQQYIVQFTSPTEYTVSYLTTPNQPSTTLVLGTGTVDIEFISEVMTILVGAGTTPFAPGDKFAFTVVNNPTPATIEVSQN